MAIEYAEIFAYMNCTGEVLSPVEIDAIAAMDDAFRKQMADTREDQRKFSEPGGEGVGLSRPTAKKM